MALHLSASRRWEGRVRGGLLVSKLHIAFMLILSGKSQIILMNSVHQKDVHHSSSLVYLHEKV